MFLGLLDIIIIGRILSQSHTVGSILFSPKTNMHVHISIGLYYYNV